jgi:hypothetical protein
MAADGDAIPPPRSFETIKSDRALADDLDGAVVAFVTPRPPRVRAAE